MFDSLTSKLNSVFKQLKSFGRLSEKDISTGLRQIKMALLEADVNYHVVKKFIVSISERALGNEVISSLTPGQQIVKIVAEEMGKLMGEDHQDLSLHGDSPISVMIVGLQGSGKTTTAGKLALYLKHKGKKPYLVSVDVYRPAAIEQLQILARQIDVPFFDAKSNMKPQEICKNARISAAKLGCDTILLDTAGRLHIDDKLMNELKDIKNLLKPSDILLVADAMTGQDAVKIAKIFNDKINIGGIILSKMDGDARGGAALSIKFVTDKPIKFIGVGEKLRELEPFHPDRMASRILGMGDLLTIIDKAQMTMDKKKVVELEKKFKKNRFSLEDFKDQMIQVKKMGSLTDILGMIPGFSNMKQVKNLNVDEVEFTRIEAIINSMTPYERENYSIVNGSRRKRIARGSGTKVQDVNRLLKNYVQVMKMMKKFKKKGLRSNFSRDMFPF